MLWVLVRSALPRCFWLVPTAYVFMEKYENCFMLMPPLILSYESNHCNYPVVIFISLGKIFLLGVLFEIKKKKKRLLF